MTPYQAILASQQEIDNTCYDRSQALSLLAIAMMFHDMLSERSHLSETTVAVARSANEFLNSPTEIAFGALQQTVSAWRQTHS